MTIFIIITVLMTLLIAAWLVRPLLRSTRSHGVSSRRLNAAIYRDQLEALQRDLARGIITPVDFETTLDELQLRLLDDAEESPQVVTTGATHWTSRRTAALVALLLPLGGAGMYWSLGAPQSIDPVSTQKAEDDKISNMVDGLAARLKTSPDNPKGWAMLARSYKVLGRLREAEQAYAKIGPLIDNDPDLLADYADLLAVAAGGDLQGQPLVLINKALLLNPAHPMALTLAGTAAYRQGNFEGAVLYWTKLLSTVEPGSQDFDQVQSNIATARAKGGAKTEIPSIAPLQPSGPPAAGNSAQATTTYKSQTIDQSGVLQTPTSEQILQMVSSLAARLKTNPDDLAGWARLARSYKVLGRLQEAEDAYAKAGKLVDSSPDMLTDYADLLATRAGNKFENRSVELINKALALNPRHTMALMLSGSVAYRRSDFVGAIVQWEKLQPAFEPGSRDAEWLSSSIADARVKAGLKASEKAKK
jgi:cytochrome c-type biogenesis protein CcmH